MDARRILKELNITASFSDDVFEFQQMALCGTTFDNVVCTFLDTEKYINQVPSLRTILITTQDIKKKLDLPNPYILVDDPRTTFFCMHNYLLSKNENEYKRPFFKTEIGEGCEISKHACISEKNVKIGKRVIIEEFVSVKENSVIEDDAIIRAGTIVGGEGFQQRRSQAGVVPVIHGGGVRISKGVEIQQNCSINKGVFPWDDTVIACGSKIADLVNVAHGVKIGMETFVAANAFIGGRTQIGDAVWIGPGVTVSNGIKINNNAKVSLGSVVTKDVGHGQRVTGNFALRHDVFMANIKKQV